MPYKSTNNATVIASAAKIQYGVLDCHSSSSLAMTMFHAVVQH